MPALMATVVCVALVTSSTALTQSDGDLLAHIALGRRILQTGIPAPVTPAWGAAMLLALLDRAGGLSLIAAGVAILAAFTHAMLLDVVLQRSVPLRIALPTAMLGVVFAASHWLARPHAFTIAASAMLIVLLARGDRGDRGQGMDRRASLAIPPLFALWANLHGGWSFGLILVACYAMARRTRPSLLLLIASALATGLTPFGVRLHLAVLQTLRDATIARVINEYQPPSLDHPQDLLFLVTLAIAAVALLRTVSRAAARPTIWALLVIIVSAAAALRAGRNIALFAVTGWPLLVMSLAPRSAITASPVPPPPSGRWPIPMAIAAAGLLLGVLGGQAIGIPAIRTPVSPTRFPVGAVQAVQRANLTAPVLTTWAWSGYVPYAWPGRRAFFNPLAFTPAEVRALGRLLLAQPGWRRTLDSLAIGLAILPPDAPLADSLRAEPTWPAWYRDPTATVFERRAPPPTEAHAIGPRTSAGGVVRTRTSPRPKAAD
jgi:hypothetical protein